MTEINQDTTWHGQPYGTPWKGVAIYHVSFSVSHTSQIEDCWGSCGIPSLERSGKGDKIMVWTLNILAQYHTELMS